MTLGFLIKYLQSFPTQYKEMEIVFSKHQSETDLRDVVTEHGIIDKQYVVIDWLIEIAMFNYRNSLLNKDVRIGDVK